MARAPEAPTGGLAKCQVAASQQNPLVTEWPASEKANLESRLATGGVIVAYSGCEMRLLPACRVPGLYRWQRTTTSTDAIEIRSEDDLYTKLPLGAAALEAELRSAGRLSVRTTVSGQLTVEGIDPDLVPNTGPCEGATHLVTSLSIGAFEMRSGGSVTASGGASLPLAGVGASTTSEENVVRSAGVPSTCAAATAESPHADCRSPIQMFLTPLPVALRNKPPPGKLRATFVSDEPETEWEVLAGDTVLCVTPCSELVPRNQRLALREKEPGFLKQARMLDVPDLKEVGADAVTVHGHGAVTGTRVGGIVLSALGGVGLMAGFFVTVIGCDESRGSTGACVTGVTLLPVSAGAVATGVVMIVTGGSEANVEPSAAVRQVGFGGTF